jgi:hypothetical protein
VTFTANGQSPVTTISQNTSATLAWNAPDALGCTGTGFSTNSAISGSVPTGNLIIGDHPYSISCYNGSGTTDSALTVSASSLCAGSNCGQVCVNVSSVQPTVGQIDAQNGQVTIASKQIAFSFTAVTPGTPPNPPTITGPTTRVPNEIGVYTFTATDPDANTIRYLVDWDMNGTVDQILPAAGYVSSGTGQPVNKSWSPLGAKNFQAKTEDSNGMTSGWTAYIVTITTQCSDGINNDAAEDLLIDLLDLGCGGDPNDNSESPNPLPVCGNGQDDDFDGYIDFGGADPSCTTGTGPSEHPVSPKATLTCTLPSPCTISPGGSATLTWSSTGTPDSCKFADQGSTVSGNGTRSVSPGATATYDIFCTKGAENSTHEQATVTVRQPRVYIEANPEHVSPVGAPSTIGWSAQSVGTCSVTESDDAGNSTTIWGPVTPVSPSIDIATPTPAMVRNIKKSYTYTITCDGGAATAKVKVNPPAGFQEF